MACYCSRMNTNLVRSSRRSFRLLCLAAVLLLVACDQNSRRLSEGEPLPPAPVGLRAQLGMPSTPGTGRSTQPESQPESQPGTSPDASGTPGGGPTEAAEAGAISGTLRLAPELDAQVSPGAAVYIIARKPSGPPVAAARFEPEFPLQFQIGKDHMMFEGAEFAGDFDLVARIAQKGTAGGAEPGDIEGKAAGNPVAVGSSSVEIVLDTVIQ